PALARQPRHLLDAHPTGVPPVVGSAAASGERAPPPLVMGDPAVARAPDPLVAHPGARLIARHADHAGQLSPAWAAGLLPVALPRHRLLLADRPRPASGISSISGPA